jgi:hypothetical protein
MDWSTMPPPVSHVGMRRKRGRASSAAADRRRCLVPSVGQNANELSALGRLVGFALLLAGVACALVAFVAHLAWAPPLTELPSRGSLLPGVLFGCPGLILIQVASWSRSRLERSRRTRDAGLVRGVGRG